MPPQDSVTFVAGARGSGKSTLMKQIARGFGRVLVYSPVEFSDGYGPELGIPVADTMPIFLELARDGQSAAYAPKFSTPDVFDVWCKIVWHIGNTLALVDELADVAPIGKATGWWGNLIRKGRHRRIAICAGAQRPAEIDKTLIGNTTRVVCFRLARLTDRKYMADEIGIDRSTIDALQPLEYLSSDRLTGRVTRGKIVFR